MGNGQTMLPPWSNYPVYISMYFVKPNCLHIQLHFHFNKMQMNTINHARFNKSLKNTQHGNQHDMYRAHQSQYFYCLKLTSRIGSVHSAHRHSTSTRVVPFSFLHASLLQC